MISSVMPSEKYSFSGSALMFLNGSTAIALGPACRLARRALRSRAVAADRAQRLGEIGGGRVAIHRRARERAGTAASTASGTSRVVRTLGIGDTNRFAMIACGVTPVKGGSPVSISYSTQPSE